MLLAEFLADVTLNGLRIEADEWYMPQPWQEVHAHDVMVVAPGHKRREALHIVMKPLVS